jgi:hypothetical protein
MNVLRIYLQAPRPPPQPKIQVCKDAKGKCATGDMNFFMCKFCAATHVDSPTRVPTSIPTRLPSSFPTTLQPTAFPTAMPTNLPTSSPSSGSVTRTGVIQVLTSDQTSLGYVADDPSYWTPLLTPDISSAINISFTTNPTNPTPFNLVSDVTSKIYLNLGGLEGRDSTSSDIASGSFNYLYISNVASTAPGAPPQHGDSYFKVSTMMDKTIESAIWSISSSNQLLPQWVNTDNSLPITIVFVQSNHVYMGGDPNAFHSRYPAPVTTVSLQFIEV